MTGNQKQQCKNKRLFLQKWQHLIALLAFTVSLISFYKSCQNEKCLSKPNVQIISFDSSRSYSMDSANNKESIDDLTISGILILKNFGKANAQISDIQWEPLIVGGAVEAKEIWLWISDRSDKISSRNKDYFYSRREYPLLGIGNSMIQPGEIREFKFGIFGKTKLSEGKEIPNVRIKLYFSNGQELSFYPNIKSSGVTGSW